VQQRDDALLYNRQLEAQVEDLTDLSNGLAQDRAQQAS
jgi:hypothetical protein